MGTLAQNYRSCLDAALKEACHPDWDQRFLKALEKQGLMLGPVNTTPDARYPQGWAFTAPLPYDDPNSWVKDAAVIYKDSQ